MSLQLGLPLAVREKELADLKSTSPERKYNVRFQGKLRPFDVYVCAIRIAKIPFRERTHSRCSTGLHRKK